MDNFCPAPWMSLFYQSNEASVCCVSSDKLNMSPNEFRESDYLKNLKTQFLAGEKPSGCNTCWKNEDQNLFSIRKHYKHNFPKYTRDFFTETTVLPIEHMELRASNLCNFQCRMCEPRNSVEIAREVAESKDLQKHFKMLPSSLTETNNFNWDQISDISLETTRLFLTGGEPLLIKQYYKLLDHLIDNNRCDTTALDIYTNCSVFNPKFVDRISKFKTVVLNLSIDAVGKVAEYQRYGTDWNIVKENAFKFNKALDTVITVVHTTVTAYNILDLSNLADFYLQMAEENSKLRFMVHVAQGPKGMNYMNLPKFLKEQAIEQIDMTLAKLPNSKAFNIVVNEFATIKTQMLKNLDNGSDYINFVHLTRAYDQSRNQKFEDVFNFKLY
jgi:MoaA/NifB/PqqE/SkfB family radical SAM enzyme